MIQIEMADVLAILKICIPYFIVFGITIILGIGIMIACRKMSRSKKFLIRGNTVLAMILVLVILINMISFGPMSTIISLSTGSGTISEERANEANEAALQVAQEGIVLLENDGLLPLDETTNVNLFGWASSNPLYGGSGSGGINDLFPIVSLSEGLDNAGFNVNEELLAFYTSYNSERPEMSIQEQSWTLPEPPVATYPEELIQGAQEFSDVAVVVLTRAAGEGHSDMPGDVSDVSFDQNSSEYEDFSAGDHYLQLSQSEEDMINMVTENFDKVALVYNGANPFELGFVDEYSEIQAVIWAPGPGNIGFNALGQIMRGEVNPSGKTSDTFVYDMTVAPWWNNWDRFRYENMTHLATDGMNQGRPEVYYPSFTNYVEGIYVGYKFYETAAQEGLINYEEAVQYPFGHGLSYSTFTQEMGSISEDDGMLSFDVTVTNTGSVAGKEVIQVYYNPPYTNGGIEKSTANLVAFDKTEVLDPGASQTVTITFPAEDMASYDALGASAYVLEEGDYTISINSNSNTILDEQTYTLNSTVIYAGDNGRSSDHLTATNQFDNVAGDVTYLSREDSFANYDIATAEPTSMILPEPYASEYHLNENYDYTAILNDDDDMPTTGADNGMELADLRGADYDDPRWESLLDQITVDEMSQLIALAGYQTATVESVGKVATVDADGPAALNNNFTNAGSIGFPIAVVIASTWNQDLALKYGEMMGKMAKEMNVAGWYAPAMNTHRMAFGGRHYEYYSEDGVLAGRIAANAITGAKNHGVYSFIKHFALYDANGKMVSIWSNEQAIREIYLKPFELSVKEGQADAVMVGWNFLGHRWVGENSNLMNTVLRDEWGFRGMAITDFFRNNGHGFMNADSALAGGVDGMLATFEGGPNFVNDPTHPTSVNAMRTASKNIMYTVVNSWAYESDNIELGLLPWQKVAITINVLLGILFLASGIWIYRKSRMMRE
ncbi:glycoside hydrolase family 3 C-terminal domain-containing protein [Salipaludibacillus sp. LMS25]|jgi:beta-glucosidase|uniref:glycoside hydrolase family 3 N-terminal domain-containing protein n=1 Tax=Salipaludibacillus sp. LMS25 TaxID=2924031 RepID=UPI0020D05FB2|nr:glycoside hydrolase family 3 N-terminal domain-containing protein [Salipaludibacillus sp. LMS25]UTR15288.1 glycoside hydrolase family 3 C-terminal domain-containing protein [Salipaludibacillus sp. LMS25]